MKEPTVVDRLRRLESRLVVGFSKLGVDVKSRESENVVVDDEHLIITVNSPGISVQAIIDKLPADAGDTIYNVKFQDRTICYLSRW